MRGSGGGSRYYRAKARPHFFQDLNLSSILQPADPAEGCFVASKVVATLGPACSDIDTLAQLLEAGMTVARIDLTWGPLDYHKRSLSNLNAAMKRVRRMCAVMVDTLGREMLIRRPFKLGPDGWPMHEQPYKVTAGSAITITTRADLEASSTLLPITYVKFPSLVLPGDIVYIGRYLACGAPEQASLYLKVEQVLADTGDVICTALNDAELHGLLTVFNLERSASELVGLQSDLPVMTEYDKMALRDLVDSGFEIDFLSISFCRSGADVREVRQFMEDIPALASVALIAKVETRQALFNFRGILEAADGIIVSRGLLGLDCVPEKVALIQKSLCSAANLVGKPVVITRVLDSMVDNPRPTRAEATDVANAVLDGADALFLGAETLRGRYPVATVRTLVSIARQAEKVFDFRHHFEWLMQAAMDAQELRDALSSGLGFGAAGFGGGGLDDDDAATDIFMLTGGMGPMGMGLHGMGSVGGGLSAMGSVPGVGGVGGGGYGEIGGLTPLSSMHLPVGVTVGAAGGGGGLTGGGLSPASMSGTNLDELADGGGGGGAAAPGGGGAVGAGHHVSFAALPPRPPPRTRSNASMPDMTGGGGAGGSGGGSGGGGSGGGAANGHPAVVPAGAMMPGAGGGGGGGGGSQSASRSQSCADINTAVAAMARFGSGPGGAGSAFAAPQAHPHAHPHPHPHHHHHGAMSVPASGRASPSVRSTTGTVYGGGPTGPYMGKLESIASSAVRAAEKVKAGLIVVYTHTSRVASLVAKYRPPMPILTLVVPRLKSDGLHWRLEGRGHARQCLLMRGLLPMLSAPGPSGDEVLEEAIAMASRLGLVGPGHYVVVVERVHDAFCLKIVAVDELGLGIQRDGPLDPAAVVVRAMVPATPVVGRTLSMMNDTRLPPAAMLRAAAAAAARGSNSGGGGVMLPGGGGGSGNMGLSHLGSMNVAAPGSAGGGGGGAGFGGGGGEFSPAAMGPVMGAITSLLAAAPSSYGTGYGALGGDVGALSGNSSGGRARRRTSHELIAAVPTSPFSGSPPVGVGLMGAAAAAPPPPPAGSAGAASAARCNLLSALMGTQLQQQQSPGGDNSPATMPVLNALGGGPPARDSLMDAAEAAAGLDGPLSSLGRGGLGAVAEEPEGMSPFFAADLTRPSGGAAGARDGAGGRGAVPGASADVGSSSNNTPPAPTHQRSPAAAPTAAGSQLLP